MFGSLQTSQRHPYPKLSILHAAFKEWASKKVGGQFAEKKAFWYHQQSYAIAQMVAKVRKMGHNNKDHSRTDPCLLPVLEVLQAHNLRKKQKVNKKKKTPSANQKMRRSLLRRLSSSPKAPQALLAQTLPSEVVPNELQQQSSEVVPPELTDQELKRMFGSSAMDPLVDLISSTESECHDEADADVLQAWEATPAADAGGESSPAIVASASAPACAASSCAGVSSSSIADVGASAMVVAGTSAPASGSVEDSTIAIDAVAAPEVGKPFWNQALQRKELVLPSGKVMVLQSSTPMEKAGAKNVLKRPAAKKRPASAIEGDHPQLKVVNANSRGATYLLGQSEGKDKLLVEVTASKSVKHKDIVQDIKASLAEMLAKDPNKSFQDLKAEALSLRTLYLQKWDHSGHLHVHHMLGYDTLGVDNSIALQTSMLG